MGYNIKSIKQEFKSRGVFYTPPELALLLKEYAPTNVSEVYDPTCGDGALLSVFEDNVNKFGQELDSEQLEVAKQRLVNFRGLCGDTLQDPLFKGCKFDLIMANPPFSVKWDPVCDERFSDAPALAPKSKADYAFLLHIIHYMSNKGVAVVLNFPGIGYRGNAEGKIRQWMIEQNLVERVVHIPGDTFVDTKIATLLLVLNKAKTTTDIVFEDRALSIVFEDRVLSIERTVSIEEVEENGFSLSVSTYIQEEKEKEIINALELHQQARTGMLSQLKRDLDFDKQVCLIEGWDFYSYVDSLIVFLNRYKYG